MKKRNALRWLPISLLLVSMLGCHPAALVVPSYIQSIGVVLVDNKTSFYGLDTVFTKALIHQFQIDGRLPVVDPDKADMVVKMSIRQYVQEPQMYDPKTNYVLQYRLSIVYDLAAVDEQEKKAFLEDTNKIHSYYFYTPQNTGAPNMTMDQAVSMLADDTAFIVVRRVLEGD